MGPTRPLDYPALLDRVAADPVRYLGQKSLSLLQSFDVGYYIALQNNRLPHLFDPLGEEFRDWIRARVEMTQEHRSRMNAGNCVSPYSYARLISLHEAEAMDTYLSLRKSALAELGPTQRDEVVAWEGEPWSLFQWLEHIRSRTGVYLEGAWTISNVWALVSGFLTCEQDHGCAPAARRTMEGFQAWMDDRYPFGRGWPWDRTIHFITLGNREQSFDSFLGQLNLYRAGEPPNTLDPLEREILQNILRHAEARKKSCRSDADPTSP